MRDEKECRTWLRDFLRNGPVRSSVILKHGARSGFKSDQIRRARVAIGAKAYKANHVERGRGKWFWSIAAPTELLYAALDDLHRMRLRLDRLARQLRRVIADGVPDDGE